MSRMHESHKANVVNTELATMALLTGSAIEEALRICHKGAEGHGGMRRTYMTLCHQNKHILVTLLAKHILVTK